MQAISELHFFSRKNVFFFNQPLFLSFLSQKKKPLAFNMRIFRIRQSCNTITKYTAQFLSGHFFGVKVQQLHINKYPRKKPLIDLSKIESSWVTFFSQ